MSDTNTTEVDEKRELVVGVTGVHGESSKETTIAGKLQVSPEHPFAEALVSGVHLSQDVDVASKGDGQQTSPTALQQVQTLAKLLTLLALPKAGSRTSKGERPCPDLCDVMLLLRLTLLLFMLASFVQICRLSISCVERTILGIQPHNLGPGQKFDATQLCPQDRRWIRWSNRNSAAIGRRCQGRTCDDHD